MLQRRSGANWPKSSCNLGADCTMALVGLAGPAGKPLQNSMKSIGSQPLGPEKKRPRVFEGFCGGKKKTTVFSKFTVPQIRKPIVFIVCDEKHITSDLFCFPYAGGSIWRKLVKVIVQSARRLRDGSGPADLAGPAEKPHQKSKKPTAAQFRNY